MATKTTKAKKQITPQDGEKLKELFIDGLKDIYWAEKSLVKALTKLSKNATSEELKSAFELHATQTESQTSANVITRMFLVIHRRLNRTSTKKGD